MAPTKVDIGAGPREAGTTPENSSEPTFHGLSFESPSLLASLWNQLRERRKASKTTIPEGYYRGEARLPVSEMGSVFQSLHDSFHSLFEKPEPPSIPITSQPVEVGDIWQDYKPQWYSGVNAVLIVAFLVAMIIMPQLMGFHPALLPKENEVIAVKISPFLAQLPPSQKKAGGGGGGGNRTPKPPSKGATPKFDWQQMAPPSATANIPKPELPVNPTLLGPPQEKLPQVAMNVWGNPTSIPGPPSNGPGTGGGIGTGNGTGIGSGNGGGLGPGSGGGTGGGVFQVGGNISAPIPIYDPQPEYSERAREAKYQGTDVLSIIVEPDGSVNPDVQVVKPLGLGLDEEAVKTVRTWKFKAAVRNGLPVAVRVDIEVTFRLF
ncbi:MAG TPA: energy transducer TonB [Terriglobia bacterium]|nr:energy transducer TonB [Terriglobia bacterium]